MIHEIQNWNKHGIGVAISSKMMVGPAAACSIVVVGGGGIEVVMAVIVVVVVFDSSRLHIRHVVAKILHGGGKSS